MEEAPSGNYLGGLPGFPSTGAFQLRDKFTCDEVISRHELKRGLTTHTSVWVVWIYSGFRSIRRCNLTGAGYRAKQTIGVGFVITGRGVIVARLPTYEITRLHAAERTKQYRATLKTNT